MDVRHRRALSATEFEEPFLCPRVLRASCFPLASAPDSRGCRDSSIAPSRMHQSERAVAAGSILAECAGRQREERQEPTLAHAGMPGPTQRTSRHCSSPPALPFPFHRRGARVRQAVRPEAEPCVLCLCPLECTVCQAVEGNRQDLAAFCPRP